MCEVGFPPSSMDFNSDQSYEYGCLYVGPLVTRIQYTIHYTNFVFLRYFVNVCSASSKQSYCLRGTYSLRNKRSPHQVQFQDTTLACCTCTKCDCQGEILMRTSQTQCTLHSILAGAHVCHVSMNCLCLQNC